MIGYYDPTSLKISGNHASIDFVNAMNGNDVRNCRMTTVEEVKSIIAGLRDQVENGLTGLLGKFARVEGVFQAIPDHPDEGIVTIADNSRIPVKVNFPVGKDNLPAQGFCIVTGEMHKGALHADSISVGPITPAADTRPEIDKG
ncbi:MAG: hypothetical protein F4213_06515 [Boseongicola sp. SB0677_bin_26]|nr:hypothetical protein [Boseongicola sp. SB0665_bin_10]MYG25663.1 hypothetical protein [Boseongicola sp. SB0677_bin_26]